MRGMKKPRPTAAANVGFAVLAAQVAPGATEVQLTPAGEFRAADGSGRPNDIEGGKPWRMTGQNAPLVLARAALQQNDFVIDYEHQTLLSKENGQPAPAAGWWNGKNMEWREGVGLFATSVTWTPKATEAIKAGEYRYISAVFFYDLKTGDVLAMRMAALTNTPGLDGMQPLAALTAQMGADWVDPCCGAGAAELTDDDEEENQLMDLLKKLLAALGLAETTTAEVALTAVTALKAKADATGTELAALKAAPPAGGAVDLTKYVPIETYTAVTTQLAALSAQGESVDGLIEKAKTDGKVFPGEEGYLKSLGASSGVAVLKAQLAARPVIPALAGMQSVALTQQQPGPGANGGQGGQLDAAGLAVCSQLGLTPEQYLGAGKAKQ